MTAPDRVTPERILQIAWGYAPPMIVEAAIRNKIFDTLDGGPKTAAEVATAGGATERGVRMLLDALTAMELIGKQGETYSLTPESSAFLVSKKRSFQGGIFLHLSKHILPGWMKLTDIVRNGRPAVSVNQQAGGAEFFAGLVEEILPMSYPSAQALAAALKLEDAKEPVSVLDVAAGSGVWSIALAQRSPQVKVTAVDWPPVIAVTRKVTAKFGVSERYQFVESDLLKADFGSGHHIATLGHIIHSEGEARSRELLGKVFNALAPGGTVVIAETMPNDDRAGPLFALLFAVNMLVSSDQGNTYTLGEMTGWLKSAGFTDVRTIPAPAQSPLVLATKPG